MTNIRLYSSKVIYFGKEASNKNNSRIPVIVVDLQTNKSVKYTSINAAARDLAAHPKTIWRKVQNKQPYLERYLIVEKYSKYNKIYLKVIEYFNIQLLFNNYTIVIYVLLLFILFGYTFYKCIPYVVILYTDVYNNYFNDIDKVKVLLEQKSTLKIDIFNSIKTPISHKINGLAEFNEEWKSIYILKNKSSFINFPCTSKPVYTNL